MFLLHRSYRGPILFLSVWKGSKVLRDPANNQAGSITLCSTKRSLTLKTKKPVFLRQGVLSSRPVSPSCLPICWNQIISSFSTETSTKKTKNKKKRKLGFQSMQCLPTWTDFFRYVSIAGFDAWTWVLVSFDHIYLDLKALFHNR